MNVRKRIIGAALACTAAGCATGHGASLQGARAKEEVYHFNGYALKVKLDDGGLPVSAKAFDKDQKEVPTFMVQAREVTVCVPKATGPAQGAGQQCEPFLYMPEKTFFKIGTGTLCSMWYMGKLIYYEC